jgi:hypothetical protein
MHTGAAPLLAPARSRRPAARPSGRRHAELQVVAPVDASPGLRPSDAQAAHVDAPLTYRRHLATGQLARVSGTRWSATPQFAREAAAPWSAASQPGEPQDASRVASELGRWAQRAADLDLDALGDPELERLLDDLRVPIVQLEATRAQGLAAMERRAARRAPSGGASAAELEQRRRNAQRQRLAPSQAKQIAEAGRAAADNAATGTAFRAGALGAEHARLIGSLLRRVPFDRRAGLEQDLVDLAAGLDPVAFGRRARELVAKQEPEVARRDERLKHERRSVRASDTPDGGFAFSGLLHGTAAETARTAFRAFRRADTPDEHRSSEQRDADAFEQLCEAALRLGDAPTDHGVRPHVIVVVEEPDLTAPNGLVRLAHSGQPATTRSVGHLLDDCVVSRLVRDAAGTPIEASAEVRTVPKGLWRALLVRDGGCTWAGCDAPASWCDVAHGNVAFRHDGRLSPDNAALLCRRHHHRFDSGLFRMVIDGNEVHYERRVPTPATTSWPMGTASGPVGATSPNGAPTGSNPDRPPPHAPGSDPVGGPVRAPIVDAGRLGGTPTLFDAASRPSGSDPP